MAFYSHSKPPSIAPLNAPPAALSAGIPRLTGIVAHQFLQWICEHHPQTIEQIPWNLARDEFKKLGFNEEMQHTALSTLQDQITQMFHNETGAWIIARHHKERNEYELLVEQQNNLVTRIIDRTFEDNGTLWIIDFKTGKEALITSTQHQKQLNEYGYYLSSRTSLPIHCGLYYLSNGHWVSWQYQPMLID